MKKIISIIILLVCVQMATAAFGSQYAPSNYFDKVKIDGVIPMNISLNWSDINLKSANKILENESVWQKNYDDIPDLIGITFMTSKKYTESLIKEIMKEMENKGVINITANTYNVPTIELTENGTTDFMIYLQNTGDKPTNYTIDVIEGKDFLQQIITDDGTTEQPFVIEPNTTSDEYPVSLKLIAPSNRSLGTFYDFVYIITNAAEVADDGSIIPVIPFTKKYKIYIVDQVQPQGLSILMPSKNYTKRNNILKTDSIIIEWSEVDEPNFFKYVVAVANNPEYNNSTERAINNISETKYEYILQEPGTYHVRVRAFDEWDNVAEVESTFEYVPSKILTFIKDNMMIFVLLILGILIWTGNKFFGGKKPQDDIEPT